MAKKIMQDMVVRRRRRPQVIEKKKEIEIQPETQFETQPEIQKLPYFTKGRTIESGEKKRTVLSKFKLAYKLAVVLFFVLAFIFVLKNFSWVTLSVTPKQEFISLDTSLVALIGTAQNTSSPDGSMSPNIYFELMEISEEGEKTIKSTGVKDLERKASGEVIIYNAYSSAPQTLVRRTRFSTPEGKIYRIDGQVVVPGAKIVGGSISPSSIEVTVYADEPGEEYNIGLSDFSIPGFKGDARYEKFYARSKTEMKGGFVGKLNVVAEDDVSSIRESLREDIKSNLVKKAEMSIPNGFLYFQDLTMIDFISSDDNSKAGDEAENFTIKEKGVLKAFLIREVDLSDSLVSKYGKSAPIRISNLKEMALTLIERNKDNNKIIFKLEGTGHFVWNIDEDSLKKDFLEKGNNKTELFFKDYPVEKVKVIHHPSWWRLIPGDDSRIKYEEILKTEF